MGIIQHVKEEFQVIKERDPAIKSPMEEKHTKQYPKRANCDTMNPISKM